MLTLYYHTGLNTSNHHVLLLSVDEESLCNRTATFPGKILGRNSSENFQAPLVKAASLSQPRAFGGRGAAILWAVTFSAPIECVLAGQRWILLSAALCCSLLPAGTKSPSLFPEFRPKRAGYHPRLRVPTTLPPKYFRWSSEQATP